MARTERDTKKRTRLMVGLALGIGGLVAIIVVSRIPPREIALLPRQFATQSTGEIGHIDDEFIFDTRSKPIRGLRESGGVDLRWYDLEFTFQGGRDKAQVQLWYKGQGFANVYSRRYPIIPGEAIRYDPFRDGRDVDEFDDFSHIWAVGAKVIGVGTQEVKLTSAKLIRRSFWLSVVSALAAGLASAFAMWFFSRRYASRRWFAQRPSSRGSRGP